MAHQEMRLAAGNATDADDTFFVTGNGDGSLRIEGDHSDAVTERRQRLGRTGSEIVELRDVADVPFGAFGVFDDQHPLAVCAGRRHSVDDSTQGNDVFARSVPQIPSQESCGSHREQSLLIREPEVLNIVLVDREVGAEQV